MSPEPDQWLSEALATRDLDCVQPNMAAAGDRINDARRHVRSAADAAERIVTAIATTLATLSRTVATPPDQERGPRKGP